MATKNDLRDWLDPEAGPPEAGYEAWFRAKVERALEQSRDRDCMIPAEEVWRELGLED